MAHDTFCSRSLISHAPFCFSLHKRSVKGVDTVEFKKLEVASSSSRVASGRLVNTVMLYDFFERLFKQSLLLSNGYWTLKNEFKNGNRQHQQHQNQKQKQKLIRHKAQTKE